MIKLTINKDSFDFIQSQFTKNFSKNAFSRAKIKFSSNIYTFCYTNENDFNDDDADIAALFANVGMTSDQMEVNDIGRKIEKIQDEYLLSKQVI